MSASRHLVALSVNSKHVHIVESQPGSKMASCNHSSFAFSRLFTALPPLFAAGQQDVVNQLFESTSFDCNRASQSYAHRNRTKEV